MRIRYGSSDGCASDLHDDPAVAVHDGDALAQVLEAVVQQLAAAAGLAAGQHRGSNVSAGAAIADIVAALVVDRLAADPDGPHRAVGCLRLELEFDDPSALLNGALLLLPGTRRIDRKSTRLNSSH